MGIRSADFAGTWYPGSRRECTKTVEGFFSEVRIPDEDYSGTGGIVPHAGWYFSGKTAASVYQGIKKVKEPELIFIFGMHLTPSSPGYIFLDEGFETPFGPISVHMEAAEMLSEKFNFIKEDSVSYSRDNTVEVQLPFLKYLFPDVKVVTCGVPFNNLALDIGKRAARVSSELGIETCFIGSTDLTHYGPNYGFVPRGTGMEAVKWVREVNDKRIVDFFVKADPSGVLMEASNSHNACCPGAASAAIAAVRERGVKRGVVADYKLSYDIIPDSSFVGYAGILY